MMDKKLKKNLLILDDEENMLHMLEALLSKSGFSITTTVSGKDALNYIQNKKYDFVLCDIRMPEMDGLTFLTLMKGIPEKLHPTVIMMSAYGTIDTALEAMKAGAYDFISKPFKKDEVLLALKKAEERECLKMENMELKHEINSVRGICGFKDLVWKSINMGEVVALGKKAAKYDTTILINGESGTGKELIAKGIHYESQRKNYQFHAINCGSIPSTLLESELFGYVKGAFTGADKNKKGLFEEAHNSTLFLDEIGELPLAMQVKLLRVLQENEIRPVGSTKNIKVNVRILAATAKNLGESVANGEFREDLFYRLNVIRVELPPLRERDEDVPLLCDHFIRKFNTVLSLNVEKISPAAMVKMLGYKWPGNVRELENAVQRGMVVSGSAVIDVKDLPKKIQNFDNSSEAEIIYSNAIRYESIKVAHREIEKDLIKKALKKTRWNKSRAAKILEISYPSLLNKIKEYSIDDV